MWVFRESEYRQWMTEAQARFECGIRLDLFERYALPLDVSETADIETALSTIPPFWNRSKINPRYTSMLSVLISEHREARETLVDTEKRKTARATTDAERNRQRLERLAGVRTSLEVIAGKGFITVEERNELIAAHKAHGLSEPEILGMIGSTPVREQPAPVASNLLDDGLPKLVRDYLRVDLAVLGYPDLFAFLHLSRGSGSTQWAEAHDRWEKEWRTKRTDEKKTAANRLLGLVKVHIVPVPEKYERALIWDRAEGLREHITIAIGRDPSDKRISAIEYEALLKHAAKLGLSAQDAARVIVELARQGGAIVEIGTPGDHLTCPNCRTIVPRKNAPERCPSCSQALWMNCPNCPARLAAGTEVCGACGLLLINAPRAEKLLQDADRLLQRGAPDAAERAINEAEALLDVTTEAVTKRRDSLKAQRAELATLIVEAGRQQRDRLLYGLMKTCKRLEELSQSVVLPNGRSAAEVRAEAEQSIREVETHTSAGDAAASLGDFENAAGAYEDALAISADAVSARSALEKCPPVGALDVAARMEGDAVEITWRGAASRSPIVFCVVRAEGHAAERLEDGVQVESTSQTSCSDNSVPAGAFVYYSVFARRGKAVSKAAKSEGVLYAAPVTNLLILGNNKAISGTWTPVPPGAEARVIRRHDRPPRHTSDGEAIAAQPGGFWDTGLENGRVYHYGVFVEYPRPPRGRAVSAIRVGQAAPQAPLAPITDLTLRGGDKGLHLSWTRPESGDVWIYRLTAPPKQTGPLDLPLPSEWGTPLSCSGDGQTTDPAPPPFQVHYVPVTVSSNRAVAGKSRRYSGVADISSLKADLEESGFKLVWTWPKDATFALIAWNDAAHPADPWEPAKGSAKVTRQGDVPQGIFELPNPAPGSYCFTVFAGYSHGGQDTLSSALSATCQVRLTLSANPCEVEYGFERVKGVFNKRRIALKLKALNRDATVLPEMVIVAKGGKAPASTISDGAAIYRFGNGITGPQLLPQGAECRVEFELRELPSTLALFFQDSRNRQNFRLKPAIGGGDFSFN
jgi:rubrerythrin